MPKKIDPAVKERAVRLVREYRSEYTSLTAAAAAVARQERLGTETVRRWALQAEVDAGRRPGVTTADAARLRELEREVRELKRANAILLAASVFFASVPASGSARRGSLVSSLPRHDAGGLSSDVRPSVPASGSARRGSLVSSLPRHDAGGLSSDVRPSVPASGSARRGSLPRHDAGGLSSDVRPRRAP
jgi:transposase